MSPSATQRGDAGKGVPTTPTTRPPDQESAEYVTPSEPDFIVPAASRTRETTRVYNGETHEVSEVSAILRADSPSVSVYIQDGALDSRTADATVAGLLGALVVRGNPASYAPESGILPTNELVFGALRSEQLPGNKQRVFIVDSSGAGDGYLCSWCDFPDLHLDGFALNPLDGDLALSISAHELYHAIHRGYDPDEEVWIDESLAEAAMTVNGYFTDAAWLRSFIEEPNVAWGPHGADVTSVHYGACLAWGTYLWEVGGVPLMQALTKEPANGWEGIDAALVATGAARDAWDLYLEMAAALYFDDPARGLGFRSLEWDDELRVTPLLESVRETVEPFGLVFFEVAAGQVFRVATEEVTAAFVEDDDELDMEFLTAGRPYSARGAGLLIVTARERTAIELEVQ